MRKVVAGLFISLNSVVEVPEKWQLLYLNHEFYAVIGAASAQSDAIRLSRGEASLVLETEILRSACGLRSG